MLRESIGNNEAVIGASGDEPALDIPLAVELVRFARAVCANDSSGITRSRQALENNSDSMTVVDAAGVIADFQGLTRMVDATGTELEDRFRLD